MLFICNMDVTMAEAPPPNSTETPVHELSAAAVTSTSEEPATAPPPVERATPQPEADHPARSGATSDTVAPEAELPIGVGATSEVVAPGSTEKPGEPEKADYLRALSLKQPFCSAFVQRKRSQESRTWKIKLPHDGTGLWVAAHAPAKTVPLDSTMLHELRQLWPEMPTVDKLPRSGILGFLHIAQVSLVPQQSGGGETALRPKSPTVPPHPADPQVCLERHPSPPTLLIFRWLPLKRSR